MKVPNLSAYVVQPHAKLSYVKVRANIVDTVLNEINMNKKDTVLNNKDWWLYQELEIKSCLYKSFGGFQ